MAQYETTLEEECRELREGLLEAGNRPSERAAKAACAYLLDHLAQYYPDREAPPNLAA